MNLSENHLFLNPEVSQNVLVIPADYFYCPYWLLNIGLFGLFSLGFIIGIGSVYGWKKLLFRILVLMNQT